MTIQERLKAPVQVSAEAIKAIFQGATLMSPTAAQLEAVIPGRSNTSVKAGDYFKVIKPSLIKQKIAGIERTLPILFIENIKGEQRPVYASGLMRQNPTISNKYNQYEDSLLNFDRGLLQGTEGKNVLQIAEMLVGDGEVYIKVDSVEPYTVKGFARDKDGNENEDPANEYNYKYSVYALSHVAKADVPTA